MSSSPYHAAASLLGDHLRTGRGLKSLAFDGASGGGKKKGAAKVPNKAAYATVCKTLQHLPALDHILDANGNKLRKAIGFEGARNKGLVYVMLYELLFGKYRRIRGGGKLKRMIVKHERELRREAEGYVKKHGEIDANGENGVSFPRYVRVNTLRASAAEVVESLREGLAEADAANSSEPVNDATAVAKKAQSAIYVDPHVPNLLVLPPSSASWLHRDHPSVKSGKVVLQDKSSCFSALAVTHGLGDESMATERCAYIDACAAPGNKTSHLAALVNSVLGDGNQSTKKRKHKGKALSTIFAFERNSARFATLSERMEQLVPSGSGVEVAPIHGDFLKSDPSDPKFANVRAIMLDPSCSGSGIVNSPDRLLENSGHDGKDGKDGKDKKRIESLSNFQLVALKHALSFPNVERVVYSTCSVHEEENEGVVSKALSEMNETEEEWQLMAPKCLAHWARRGKEARGLTKDEAKCLVRCDGLDGDETNGFFVALFVRRGIVERVEGAQKSPTVDDAPMKAKRGDLPVYEGQFSNVLNEGGGASAAGSASVPLEGDADANQKMQHVKTTQQEKSKAAPSGKATDKSAKKREKKLAWKRRQALQKAERLKKREDAASNAT